MSEVKLHTMKKANFNPLSNYIIGRLLSNNFKIKQSVREHLVR